MVTPTVSRLLGWQPDRVEAAGQRLLNRAEDLQRSAGELTAIGSGLSQVWSGAAAQAATAHHTRRSGEVDDLATVVYGAGQTLIRAAGAIGRARASLQSSLSAASASGCTVLDDGSVLPPARPAVPVGLAPQDRVLWQKEADLTASSQAAAAARLAQQIRAALDDAGAADDTTASALDAVRAPKISAPPQPVRMGLTGGQWGPVAPPSCPTVQAAPAAQRAEAEEAGEDDSFLFTAVGGIGAGLWKVGPGVIGDVADVIPLGATQALADVSDQAYDDLSQWYGADTSSGVYRTADLGTQGVGFVLTGGVGALKAVPAAIKAAPSAVRAGGAAVNRVRAAGLAGDMGSASVDLLTGGLSRVKEVPLWLARIRAGQQWHLDEQVRLAKLDANNISELHVRPPAGAPLRSRLTHNRVDVYNPALREIVSLKHTQLADISEKTALRYITELATKYKPGTTISATASNPSALHGADLVGQMILQVPKQEKEIPAVVVAYARRMKVALRQAPSLPPS